MGAGDWPGAGVGCGDGCGAGVGICCGAGDGVAPVLEVSPLPSLPLELLLLGLLLLMSGLGLLLVFCGADAALGPSDPLSGLLVPGLPLGS